jgi:hypothetical protein
MIQLFGGTSEPPPKTFRFDFEQVDGYQHHNADINIRPLHSMRLDEAIPNLQQLFI